MADSEMNVNDMLREVLGDPDTMKKLADIAGGLFSGLEKAEKSEADGVPSAEGQGKVKSLVTGGDEQGGDDNRSLLAGLLPGVDLGRMGDEDQIRLIKALRPYLSEGRRQTADGIIRLLKMLQLANLGKRLENGR